MSALFNKLNLKDQNKIHVINAPDSFEGNLNELEDVHVFRHTDEGDRVEFALVFITTRNEVDIFARAIADKAPGDVIVWFAYPKKSSKKYVSEIDRDSGWDVLAELGFRPVRQVAIDQDWSALRFRRTSFVGS